jgi:hypothetical protein
MSAVTKFLRDAWSIESGSTTTSASEDDDGADEEAVGADEACDELAAAASDEAASGADEAAADGWVAAADADEVCGLEATTAPGVGGEVPRETRKIPMTIKTPRASTPQPMSLVFALVFRLAT